MTSFEAALSLKTLTSIDLSHNELASLPATELKVVDGESELPPLNAVTKADFSYNKLTKDSIEGVKTYFKVDGLTSLILKGNGLTKEDVTGVQEYYTKATVDVTEETPETSEPVSE